MLHLKVIITVIAVIIMNCAGVVLVACMKGILGDSERNNLLYTDIEI
jgi:hypothetical protein